MTQETTIEEAAEQFVQFLNTIGKKAGTVETARRLLDRFAKFFDPSKKLSSLRSLDVGRYFKSKQVLELKSGKSRSELSVRQTRRIIRQFLFWCYEQGTLDVLPVPKDEAKYGGVLPGGRGHARRKVVKVGVN